MGQVLNIPPPVDSVYPVVPPLLRMRRICVVSDAVLTCEIINLNWGTTF